ncbi:hypothetical protein M422DRAFT_37552 [Sphaerobolus stellatus SS14]|uniref:Uncharacterized protein n=1 Tax=Sphaerobolus stellatus (strain SS14) TaxID=990650 RepID=A0A0C9URB2_SPHS4|nr:hypothetical protein M422DRAFT_37552 [Sphaerobolus stellatus SS14]
MAHIKTCINPAITEKHCKRCGSKTFLRRLFGVGSSLGEEKEEAGLGCSIES